jgi:hypothetical protein
MLTKLLLGLLVMALCVGFHATGLLAIFRGVSVAPTAGRGGFASSTRRLIVAAAWTVLLHLGQILLWAAVYTAGGAMPGFPTAAYFSAVTYTTTGYGDLVLPEDWRLVGAIEALTGILMCGLSTGMFFAVFSRILGLARNHTPPP